MTDATHNADLGGHMRSEFETLDVEKHFSLSKPDALEANHPMTNLP